MYVSIRSIGNSRGIVIPKPMLAQLGLIDEVDLTIEGGALVIRKPALSWSSARTPRMRRTALAWG